MTQKVCFSASGSEFQFKVFFNGGWFNLSSQLSKSQGVISQRNTPTKCFEVEVGSHILDAQLIVRAQGSASATITNNGHVIKSFSNTRGTGRFLDTNGKITIEIAELEDTTPPVIEPPEIFPENEVFANVFDNGVLSRSGQFKLSELESLPSPRWTFEIITQEEVNPPDLGDINTTPQNPFFRDKDGNKVYKVELVDSITITDTQ